MNFVAGDIVEIFAPTVGYKKYHLCLGQNEAGVLCFIFLNSKGGYESNISFDCRRFPMIKVSDTGTTVASLSLVIMYNEKQLQLYKARKLGEISKDVAIEINDFAASVKTLTKPQKSFVCGRLKGICDKI
jgi:hypothetical protein